MNWLSRSHKSIQHLTPYQPGKPIETLERELGISNSIKLASNENPLGVSPYVREAIAKASTDVARYPDSDSYALKEALAEKFHLEHKHFTLGNGSDELFRLLAQTFTSPGDEALFFQHAFAAYAVCSQAYQLHCKEIATDHWQVNLANILPQLTEKTKIIFVANPNNPTGCWFKHQELQSFLQQLPKHILFVLDEAYYEYMDEIDYPRATQLQLQFDNLVVTRTFSKAYGLGGLRVGYAIAHPEIGDAINRIRLPFNNNGLAQVAALAALQDEEHLQQSQEVNKNGLRQLHKGLAGLPLDIISQQGNFVTLEFKSAAAPIYQALLRQGVIVRPLANYQLNQHLRVSVGLGTENERFISSLSKVMCGQECLS